MSFSDPQAFFVLMKIQAGPNCSVFNSFQQYLLKQNTKDEIGQKKRGKKNNQSCSKESFNAHSFNIALTAQKKTSNPHPHQTPAFGLVHCTSPQNHLFYKKEVNLIFFFDKMKYMV